MTPRRPSARRQHDAPGDPAITLRSALDVEADEPDRQALGSLASGAVASDPGDDRWVDAAAAALDIDSTREFWGESTGWRDEPGRGERGRGRAARPRRRSRTADEPSDPHPTAGGDDTASIRARRAAVRADGSLQRTRSHRIIDPEAPRPGPVPAAPDPDRVPVDRRATVGVDPLLLRLGALVVVGVLLVPIVMAMRSSADPRDFGLRTMASGDVAEWLPLPAVARTTPLEAATAAIDHVETATAVDAPVNDVGPAEVAEVVDDGGTTAEAAAASQDAAPPADAAATTSCAIEYTVGAGDYWLRLADESGVPLADLLRANSATVESPLYPGDDVCLPEGAQRPSPPPAPTIAATSPSATAAADDMGDTTAASTATTATDAPATTAAPVTTAPPSTAAPSTAPATTAPATTVPATTAVPPAPAASPDEVRQIIREVWPEELQEKALQVADRESRFRADAYNGWCCYGVFQIHWDAHRSWLSARGVTSAAQLYDARTNVELAYAIYQRSGGWGPWSQTAY